jgi:hypothetical protein
MSQTAADQPELDASTSDSGEVAERLAWLASAGTEEEALVIESALLAQTPKGSEEEE